MSTTISKMNQYNLSQNNENAGNSYLNFHTKNDKEFKESEAQELKIEDMKIMDIESDLDYLYEIAYKTYKKEFTKDKSFSIESDDEINEEIEIIVNDFEERMKLRNQNLSDSLLSEVLDDVEFTHTVPSNNRLKDKNKNAKKNINEVKNFSANTGYGNSKYSKKSNQVAMNNHNNPNNNNINKKREINVELSEEDDVANQNFNNLNDNFNNMHSNNLDFVKRIDSNLSEISKNDNFISSNNISSYVNNKRPSAVSNTKDNNINNLDSELNLEISDSKKGQNESYLEKNLQTEDFNLSYSEVNIKQNVSRLSKQDNSIMGSNDVSLSHQSVFRNSIISRNPSFVMNKFQFFSNDENDMDNFNFKHRIPAGDNLLRNSLGQSQNDLQKLAKSHKDFEALRKSGNWNNSGLPHQNSNSLLAVSNNANIQNLENKSIDYTGSEVINVISDNIPNANFNVNKSISTSKLHLINSNNENNVNRISPEKTNNKKEYSYTNNNLSKFINYPSSKNLNNHALLQNINQPITPNLDHLISYDEFKETQKLNKNLNVSANMKSYEKGTELNSASNNNNNNNFPSDLGGYSNKFLSVSNNLINSASHEENFLSKNALIESYFERITNFKQINIKNFYFEAKINFSDLNSDDSFLAKFITLFDKNNFMNEAKIKTILDKFHNRYEIHFFYMIHKYLELKKHIFTNLNQKNILTLKNQLIELIIESNKKIEKNELLLNGNFNLTSLNNLGASGNNNSDIFIFKPLLLLKFWDNSTEDNHIQTYLELNKLFIVKTLLKTNEIVKAFNELSNVLNDENMFMNSHLLLYYFGKIITQLITKIEKGQVTDSTINEFLQRDKLENYNKIKRILREFGQPNSYNYKKRAKNYENLAKISAYFGIDQKKIEIFNKRAKKYMEYYNDPSKLTLTKENKTGRDSAGSL